MTRRKWPLGFLLRVAALAAAFAVLISLEAYVQAVDIGRTRQVLRAEMRGSACLVDAYRILRDLQAFERSASVSSGALERDVAHFDATHCAPDSRQWASIRARFERRTVAAAEWSALATRMVAIMNAIGDRTNLTYDPNPVVLNLGDAAAYALPEAQTHLFEAAASQSRVRAAKFQATAAELISTADYDINAALSRRPALTATLTQPLAHLRSAARAYWARLDVWENGVTNGRLQQRDIVAAMQVAAAKTDIVVGAVGTAIDRELALEMSALERRLHVIWVVYACALVAGCGIVWLIASSSLRREKAALRQMQQEGSRLQAELARDRAELELGRREARFQAIFAGSPLPIAITDLEGEVVECNHAYLHLIGCTVATRTRRLLLAPLSIEPRHALEEIFERLRTEADHAQQTDLLLTHRNETRVWCHATVSVVPNAGGIPDRCTVMLQDITDRKERERQLQYEATHDFLTGLPNRAFVFASLQDHLARDRTTRPRFAVLFMDVDDFKAINDTLGHRAGDDCLKMVAVRLASLVREIDVVTRYGGDEFVILLVDPTSVANAREVAARIEIAFRTPLAVGDATVTISLSAGVMLDRHGYDSAEQVLREADTAMYGDKTSGRKHPAKIALAPQLASPV